MKITNMIQQVDPRTFRPQIVLTITLDMGEVIDIKDDQYVVFKEKYFADLVGKDLLDQIQQGVDVLQWHP